MGRGLHAACMRSSSNEINLTWTTYRTLSTQPFKLCEVAVFQRGVGHSSCTWGAKQIAEQGFISFSHDIDSPESYRDRKEIQMFRYSVS
jgi:hypothetical protein